MEKEIYYGSGLSREDYGQDKVLLKDFEALESDWKELFRWVMSAGREIDFYDEQKEKKGAVSDLWYNHIFTVLIEIVQKDVDSYKTSFIQGRGTSSQQFYTGKLNRRIREWMARIEKYLQSGWQTGQNVEKNPSIQAAQMIKKRLNDSLSTTLDKENRLNRVMSMENREYYEMLSAIGDIKKHAGYYVGMIEKNGDMDAGLALLLTFIRNYSTIVQSFNHKFSGIHSFYLKDILHVAGREITPDRTYVVVNPKPSVQPLLLPAGTRFKAGTGKDGKELMYKTESAETITGLKISQVNSSWLEKANSRVKAVCKQAVDFANPATHTRLLPHGISHTCAGYDGGWQIESAIFLLREGKRKVSIQMLLTPESASYLHSIDFSTGHTGEAFSLWISCEEGWISKEPQLRGENSGLTFEFTLDDQDKATTACITEVHGAATRFPVVKILAGTKNCPYEWASRIEFYSIRLTTEVEGIRTFNLYNELGEADPTQPFYPFGTQSQKGAWFTFGTDEWGGKYLEEVRLEGIWNKLPQTENGFAGVYKEYQQTPAITNESFKINIQRKENGRWTDCGDTLKPLFQTTEGRLDETAEITLVLPSMYGQRNNLFRVVLQEPAIGFGMDVYRELFAETMMYNSRQKESKRRNIPMMPVTPVLSDMELSYKACLQVNMDNYIDNTFIRLSRLMAFPDSMTVPVMKNEPQPVIFPLESDSALYIGFNNMPERSPVKMYFDMVFVSQHTSMDKPPCLVFDYMDHHHHQWIPLSGESVKAEHTHGLTQSGYIEILMPDKVQEDSPDLQTVFWLRIRISGDAGACLSIRCIYLNCLGVVAETGDGMPLPVGSIQKLQEDSPGIESIIQPFSGFGGCPAETAAQSAVRQGGRIANRNRAVTPSDYEQMVLERFHDVKKVCCIPRWGERTAPEVVIIPFPDVDENTRFPATPSWKLAEIEKFISTFTSPFVHLRVINPTYQTVDIECTAVLKENVSDQGIVSGRMTRRIREYYAWWQEKGLLPNLGQRYSYKELHTRLANDEGINELCTLTVNDETLDDIDVDATDKYFLGDTPWSIIVPGKITIKLLRGKADVEKGKIGSSFKIG